MVTIGSSIAPKRQNDMPKKNNEQQTKKQEYRAFKKKDKQAPKD